MSSAEFGRKAAMRGSASLLVLAAFAAAVPALAQAESGSMETIVVTGVRASIENAIQIKRNADTVVDSISSTDIGVFPDKSISDALQRVPGITVNRLQSNDDSTHPSGEPTSILLRGLTQVQTLFNGHDSFSADGHRGLNFNDISPEMLAGVDSFKNQTADMIEGGIAGTVNLKTRLPFDADDHVLSFSGKANYNDRSDVGTFDYSGMAGKNFDTPYGKFGILLGYANSHVVTQTNSVITLRNGTFCSGGDLDASGKAIVGSDGSIPCTANPYGGSNWAYIPDQVNYSNVNYNRHREGKALALQWASPSGDMRWNFQYNDSAYRNAWLERSSNFNLFGEWAAPGFNPLSTQAVMPAAGTSAFTWNGDGSLKHGVLTQNIFSSGWRGSWGGMTVQDAIDSASAVPGKPYVNACAAPQVCATNTLGVTLENQSRVFDHSEATRDFSTAFAWDITPKLHVNVEGNYISAKTGNTDLLVADDILVNADYTRDGNGPPSIKVLPGDNVNYAPGFLTNPHNYWVNFIQDHFEDNYAQESAIKGDAQYDIDNGWLTYVKFGGRYSARIQDVKYSAYNWNAVSANYMCNGPAFNIDNTTPAAYPASCGHNGSFNGYGANIWEQGDFGSDFFDGNVFNPGPSYFLKNSILKDPNAAAMALSNRAVNEPGGWNPLCSRTANTDGCFVPSEILNVTEKVTALYAQIGFGGDSLALFGIPVSGNMGVRWVMTDLVSTGGISYPQNTWYQNQLTGAPCSTPVSGTQVTNIRCWVTPELGAFSNGASGLSSYGKTSYIMLPSFNVKFDLSDKSILRFAASEAMARPDFGYLRNYVSINSPAIDVSNTSNYVKYSSPTAAHTPANVTGYDFVFTADAGNAGLRPETAWQFDGSYEYYINSSSSVAADVFLKELNNSIAYGSVARTFTNNGSSQTVLVRGPVNSSNGGELWGFEMAYQQFFDFLPDPFDGLGAQLNYTHTHQSGIKNSNLAVQSGYTAGSTVAFGGGNTVDNAVMDSHRLAGISDDSYNIVALYEKGPIAFRAAWNWRSSFLTDNLDCCTGTPMFQKAAGFLDAHLGYKLNEHVELSLDGSNLMDTRITFQQQLFGDTSLTPKAALVKKDTGWSYSGRLLQFAVRVKY
jgi:TonB-dependent receptor